jgi:hypothetical protein
MPAYGIIPDSPWITYGGKALRATKKSRRSVGLNLVPRGVSLKFSKLVIYKPILNFELNHSHGIVGRHLHRTANRITQLAKLQVGKKTGRLRESIRFEHIGRSVLGPRVKVGAYTTYAMVHHQGSRPRIIKPKNADGVLIFRKGPRIITTKVVRHPGTRPNRYLTDPMRRVVTSSR